MSAVNETLIRDVVAEVLARLGNVPAAAKPRRVRRSSFYAKPPPAPVHPSLTPEKSYADAAHFYGKEEAPPYRTE